MDIVLLRSRLAGFLGEIQYRKFIEQIVTFARHQGRLRYWQQDAWNDFIANYPEYSCSHQTICDVFDLCHLHFCEFKEAEVPVFQGCVDFSRDYERDMALHFPYSLHDFVSTEGQETAATHATIRYCESCESVAQRSRWKRRS